MIKLVQSRNQETKLNKITERILRLIGWRRIRVVGGTGDKWRCVPGQCDSWHTLQISQCFYSQTQIKEPDAKLKAARRPGDRGTRGASRSGGSRWPGTVKKHQDTGPGSSSPCPTVWIFGQTALCGPQSPHLEVTDSTRWAKFLNYFFTNYTFFLESDTDLSDVKMCPASWHLDIANLTVSFGSLSGRVRMCVHVWCVIMKRHHTTLGSTAFSHLVH